MLTGANSVKDRSEICTSSVNSLLSFVTSRIYIDNFFDKSIKPKVRFLLLYLHVIVIINALFGSDLRSLK